MRLHGTSLGFVSASVVVSSERALALLTMHAARIVDKHTETFLSGRGDEYIPIQDYLLRHNRAIFWVVEDMIPFGNHPLFRYVYELLLRVLAYHS